MFDRHEKNEYNNNNRIFMAPHLIRVWSTYKDTRIHSSHAHTHKHTHAHTRAHTHTHTHYKYMRYW